jgi:hypothetical protein
METALHVTASRLSDRDLLRRVAALAGQERHATVELVAHLAEVDKRKLYRGEGYGSLFTYCTGALLLGENATYQRIVAARACSRFPALLQHLVDGSLNLSTLRLIAPHLTRGKLDSLLGEVVGRRKRDVEALVAGLAPQPDVAPSVRKLPAKPALVVCNPSPVELPPELRLRPPSGTEAPPPARIADLPLVLPAPPPQTPPVAAVAPARYRMQFTVAAETHDIFRQVQTLLRREIPDGDPATIFQRALSLLLDDAARKKLAATDGPRPRRAKANPGSRYKPAALVRAVWSRDGGRCAFVARNGRRCGEVSFLEFHHLDAHALGGEMTEGNISLRCRAHNQYEAELVFGPRVPTVREPGFNDVSANRRRRESGHKQLRRTGPGTSSMFQLIPLEADHGLNRT